MSLGDSSKLPVECKGKIKIYQKDGYKVYMENNHLWLENAKGRLIPCVKMIRNRMFPLHLNTEIEKYFQGLVKNESWRWHLRFGLLNFSGLKLLSIIDMIRDLPTTDPPSHTCELCIICRQARLLFPRGKSWRAEAPLQLVHTDICGPLDPVSVGGNRYFITFIDDFNRKLWVYILKKKICCLYYLQEF